MQIADRARLELLTIRAENALRDHPDSKVAADLIWLTTQLREAWNQLERIQTNG